MEPSSLPYIDLGAPPATLKQYALDHFGKKISAQAKDETVVDRFQAIYFEETGVQLKPIEESADEADDNDKGQAEVKRKPVAATIRVQDNPLDRGAIVGGVNFVSYRIMREVDVKVSIPVLEALRNGKTSLHDPETLEEKVVQTYPFSIVEMHY